MEGERKQQRGAKKERNGPKEKTRIKEKEIEDKSRKAVLRTVVLFYDNSNIK